MVSLSVAGRQSSLQGGEGVRSETPAPSAQYDSSVLSPDSAAFTTLSRRANMWLLLRWWEAVPQDLLWLRAKCPAPPQQLPGPGGTPGTVRGAATLNPPGSVWGKGRGVGGPGCRSPRRPASYSCW